MKRTLRIEVVRYTRETTVSGREGEATPDAAESPAARLLKAPGAVSPAEHSCTHPEGEAGPPVPRQGRFHRLKDWLGWD